MKPKKKEKKIIIKIIKDKTKTERFPTKVGNLNKKNNNNKKQNKNFVGRP